MLKDRGNGDENQCEVEVSYKEGLQIGNMLRCTRRVGDGYWRLHYGAKLRLQGYTTNKNTSATDRHLQPAGRHTSAPISSHCRPDTSKDRIIIQQACVIDMRSKVCTFQN